MLSAAEEVELNSLFDIWLQFKYKLGAEVFYYRVMKSYLTFFIHFLVALHFMNSVKCDEDDDVPDGPVADCGYSLRKAPKMSNIKE